MPEPVIELLTRPGCHLCEDARLIVSEICAEYGLDYTELDITDNPDLLKRHETEIPVLRIDGEAKDFWRINPKRMRKILDKKLAR
ncbi:glutaredoxin family protein [Rothia dentocariosa]|jgi:redoxin|uniref:glutaredoxin family protein n=1 Tax=Rothia dentocariosa TaxID=2047 RepID=UPI00241E1B88|nr:glutaredoxin family protein [Rothia dentocariosa]